MGKNYVFGKCTYVVDYFNMAEVPFTISCFTAEKDLSDLKLPRNNSKSDIEVVSDILHIHNVVVLPKPSENCCSDLWITEKTRICEALSSIKVVWPQYIGWSVCVAAKLKQFF